MDLRNLLPLYREQGDHHLVNRVHRGEFYIFFVAADFFTIASLGAKN